MVNMSLSNEEIKQKLFKELPGRLRLLRKQKGITQGDVAHLLNVSRSTYTYYEIGKSYISLAGLIRLADYYGTTTDYLLGRTSSPEGISIK